MPHPRPFSPGVDGGPPGTEIDGMRRQGGGFGFVMLLVVLAIVLFAALRNMHAVAPEAMEIQRHNAARKASDGAPADGSKPASTSSNADSWTEAPPSRPNLSTMDQKTTEHSNDVQNALSQSN